MFDYIIVGGGTAGPVLAKRLSDDPTVTVLMLEAGKENTYEASQYVNGVFAMVMGEANWGYQSTPQQHLNNRKIAQPRGKVIGGSAAINVGSWSRGAQENYEAWGLNGWDWETVLAKYQQIENSPGSNPIYRGQKGPMLLEGTPSGTFMTDVFRDASLEMGIGITDDRNAANPIGFDLWECIFRNGRRHNTDVSYLQGARSRSNLKIETEAYVSKIIFNGRRANGVVYIRGRETITVAAKQEIVLCAGVINTPQLLMLSGVGPAEHLRSHDIQVVKDLSGVGSNLSDHLRVEVGALAPEGIGETLYANAQDPAQLREWRETGYGSLAVAENTSAAFFKSRPDVPAPDLELMYNINPSYLNRQSNPDRAGYYINVGLIQPKSRGSVRLASADPTEKPLFDPQYLSDPQDIEVFKIGVRTALEYTKTEALSPYTDVSTLSIASDADDAQLEAYIRTVAETIYHPVGTAKMGHDDDPAAVVDSTLKVKGIAGLRIADASVLPTLVSGHTMAPTILVAEMAADFMMT